jgi:hypothetical protein
MSYYRAFSQNDRNILYHAAPVSGLCYPLDPDTGAYFYNTGDFLYSHCKQKILVVKMRIS